MGLAGAVVDQSGAQVAADRALENQAEVLGAAANPHELGVAGARRTKSTE